MIIKKNKEPNLVFTKHLLNGLNKATLDGDKFKFQHAQNVSPILDFAHKMREGDTNGFTRDKEMRMIGYIPEMEFLNHPEFMKDPNEIVKWLKTDAGAPYRTVKRGI